MANENRITIEVEDHLLDGRLALVKENPRGNLIVTHPHPLYGGDMNNPVVVQIQRTAYAFGFHTLRFNTRGNGASTGVYGDGHGEAVDLMHCVRYLQKQTSVDLVTGLAGYSFGAWVITLALAELSDTKGVFMVSLPITMFNPSGIQNYSGYKHFVLGDSDDFTSVSIMTQFFDTVSTPRHLKILPGVNHFNISSSKEFQPEVEQYLQSLLT